MVTCLRIPTLYSLVLSGCTHLLVCHLGVSQQRTEGVFSCSVLASQYNPSDEVEFLFSHSLSRKLTLIVVIGTGTRLQDYEYNYLLASPTHVLKCVW